MHTYCLYWPTPITPQAISAALSIPMTPSIEGTRIGESDGRFVFWSRFHVVGFFGFGPLELEELLRKLEYPEKKGEGTFQDYLVEIDPMLPSPFRVTSEAIYVKNLTRDTVAITLLVVAQSVGLDKYEQTLEGHFAKSREIFASYERQRIRDRKRLMSFVAMLIRLRNEMIGDLYLLDKPEVLWEDEELEGLYNALSVHLELKARFEIVRDKLETLKEDARLLVDLVNHKSSEFLEWVIIILIAVEIVMGFYEMFSA